MEQWAKDRNTVHTEEEIIGFKYILSSAFKYNERNES